MTGRPLWYVVTPLYKPAPGGAAVYSDSLARALAADGADVVVATEAFPGEPSLGKIENGRGSITVDRLFPLRAGRAERDWRSYLAYARQNLRMLGLPARVARAARERRSADVTVLVHSSWFYNRSVLPSRIDALRRALPGRTKLVADVRDPKVHAGLVPVLSRFDAAIGCSRTIADDLRALLPSRTEVAHIPIPFEPPEPPSPGEIAAALATHDLTGVPYLFNPNGVSEEKRYPDMLEVVRALRGLAGWERTTLVTVGRSRDWKPRDDAAVAEGLLHYVGVVPHRTALALAAGGRATMILSRIEGMPRSGLEALAIGKPLLAPDIDEFRQFIPASVVRSEKPLEIARQVVELVADPPAERYPLEHHDMAALVRSYRALEPNAPTGQEIRA
jgi:glycosyltransferase involved in cell wall biosynthesis